MTPAVDALTEAGVDFDVVTYPHDPAHPSYGLEAADALGLEPDEVFKTLLVELVGGDHDGGLAVAVVPVADRLDLKAAARAFGAKRATMAGVARAERTTGYVAGGISPFGQRRVLPTAVDETVVLFPRVHVSGGRRGLEVAVAPGDLVTLLDAVVAPLTV